MAIDKIKFPALVFGPNYNTVECINGRENLSMTTQSGFKNGIVIGNNIVDSLGKSFLTVSARKISNVYPFWKFEFFNPFIYIELELEEKNEGLDLQTLKTKVLQTLLMQYEQQDVEEVRESIEKAASYEALFLIIAYDI